MMEKGLQIRGSQTDLQKHTRDLLSKIEDGTIDSTFLISHRLPLEDHGYKTSKEKQDSWTKVVLKPGKQGLSS